MKRQSHIAKEIRSNGYMFSEETLKNDLKKLVPAFHEKGVTFYPDNTAEILQVNYKRKPTKIEVEVATVVVPVELTEVIPTQMDRIEATLLRLVKAFDLWNPAQPSNPSRTIETIRKA